MNSKIFTLDKFKSNLDQSWFVSFLSSLLLMILFSFQIYFFKVNIIFSELVILIFSIGFSSFLLVRYLINVFIYNKIKLIYKSINDFKAKPGDFDDNNLSQVEKDVQVWNKKREQEIQKLEIRESYRRQFVGNVAHELKTPIFNIQGYIDSLIGGAIEDDKINMKFLERANKSVNRMIHIVEDLDQITKLEGGKIDIEEQPVDIIDIIHEVVEHLELKAKKRSVSITIIQTQKGRFMVKADIEKIKQVLINLIDNAIKYGGENGEILIRTYDMDENILIEVADNGVGINQKHLNKIFDRFYRIDESRDRDKGGSGLGLSIVKHIIEAHNQVVNIRSTEGTGTTFSFTLEKA